MMNFLETQELLQAYQPMAMVRPNGIVIQRSIPIITLII
jgi:hypothetical protein